jgi:hypothetical protein
VLSSAVNRQGIRREMRQICQRYMLNSGHGARVVCHLLCSQSTVRSLGFVGCGMYNVKSQVDKIGVQTGPGVPALFPARLMTCRSPPESVAPRGRNCMARTDFSRIQCA